MNQDHRNDRFSKLAVWAIAFGCAVGWDSLLLPGRALLPVAGPLGSVLGILLGGLCMLAIAWNFHFMVKRRPHPGGAYTFTATTFGGDHGFLCGWFFCLVYVAIVWMDATVLTYISHYALGRCFDFGFNYRVAGFEIRLGHIVLSAVAVTAASAICLRRRLAGRMQIFLAFLFAAVVVACFVAAVCARDGQSWSLGPAFAKGGKPVFQVMKIVMLSPWLFIGFESPAHISTEFRFSIRKSFSVMAAAIGAAVAAYILLTGTAVLAPFAEGGDWAARLASLGEEEYPGFAATALSFGRFGTAIVGVGLVGAVFTNLIGNTLAASRLLSAMADDGALPAWLGRRDSAGSPRNAILAIACVSIVVPMLGQMVVGAIVDIAIIGTAVAYGYTSAATMVNAHAAGDRVSRATGLFGVVFSVAVLLAFVMQVFSGDVKMSTESFIVLVDWCICGLGCFLLMFRRDRQRKFGRNSVVWMSLLAIILVLSLMWVRRITQETTSATFDGIVQLHHAECHRERSQQEHLWHSRQMASYLRAKQAFVNDSIMRDSFVQVGVTVFSLLLLSCIYEILRRREHELEEEKSKAKSYFFSSISHDIRTPLNAIIGFSEMLKTGFKTEAERNQALDAVMTSGKTLLGLINDVLDLSKLESGRMEILPEPTDCETLLQGVVDAFRVMRRNPEVELVCAIGEMPALMIDPQRLRQIAFNLVGNAVKFTEHGHVALRAVFERYDDSDSGSFKMSVEDTGCGIGEEDLKHICSAYVQVGTASQRKGGTGLGLAICKQLVTAMGGEMTVKSALGRGSVFTIVIPDVSPSGKPGGGETARASAGDGPAPAPRQKIHRILLVDDTKLNLMVMSAMLKKLGDFELATAADGLEALAALEDSDGRPFDLVLTDMVMPELDGDGLVKAIRANPALASLRVLAVTADVEVRDQASKMGFDGILLKPVTSEMLSRALAEAEGDGR